MSDDESKKEVASIEGVDEENAEELLASQQVSNASAFTEPEQAEPSTSQHIEVEELQNEDEGALSENEAALSEHEVAPGEHEVAPSEHEVAPSEHEVAPAEHEVAPSEHEVAPSEHEVAPSEHEVAPSEHEVAPSEHKTVLSEHEAVLYEHEAAPSEHEETPSEHKTVLSEHGEVPSKHEEAPSEHEAGPSEHQGTHSENEVTNSNSYMAPIQEETSSWPFEENTSNYESSEQPNDVSAENLENSYNNPEDPSLAYDGSFYETDNVNDLTSENAQDIMVMSDGTGSKRSSTRGSVKFVEPLNEPHLLESQYKELMGDEEEIPNDFLGQDDFDEFPPELNEASEKSLAPTSLISHYSTNDETDLLMTETFASSARTSRRMSTLTHRTSEQTTNEIPQTDIHEMSQNDPYGAFEITPEDIFNEIKIARTENQENDKSQNLHSFIISKTYSSENVVVLLNLRRLKDGEWVLDKTIAQGLKPQTYGGVVSIDQYDFTEHPSKQQIPSDAPSVHKVPEDAHADTAISNLENKDIMDILQKMEDYVKEVNREIQAAREMLKNSPMCKNGTLNTNDESCEPPNFDELPFIDKLVKMFNVLIAAEDEPCCNMCNNVDTSSEQSDIGYWLRAIMQEISNFCPAMLLPKALNDVRQIATSSAAILSHSQAIMEEVKNSGLLDKLSNTGLLVSNTTGVLEKFSTTSGLLDKISTTSGLLDKISNTTGLLNSGLLSKTKPSTHVDGEITQAESASSSVAPSATSTQSAFSNFPAAKSGAHGSTESNAIPSSSAAESIMAATASVESHANPSNTAAPATLPSKFEVDVVKPPIKKDIDVSLDPSNATSLQLNIESKDDLDEFIKEHENEL